MFISNWELKQHICCVLYPLGWFIGSSKPSWQRDPVSSKGAIGSMRLVDFPISLGIQSPSENGNGTKTPFWGGDYTPQSSSDKVIGSLGYIPDWLIFCGKCTPWKIDMEHVWTCPKMEVWKMIFPFNWVIFRFQSLIFQGVGKYVVRPIDPSWVFDVFLLKVWNGFSCWCFLGWRWGKKLDKRKKTWSLTKTLDHRVGWFPWIYLSHMLRMGLEYLPTWMAEIDGNYV